MTLRQEIIDILDYYKFAYDANSSEEELIKNLKEINEEDWKSISRFQTLSENFIREFKDKISWRSISANQTLSENFIREFQDEISWFYISCSKDLSENFIREFQNEVNWVFISSRQTLSENFIREFKDKVDWNYISSNQVLSENFIKEFQDKINWVFISSRQTLSEDFIREFKDKVDWNYISSNQVLSENFIKEFQDKINWKFINCYQKLSYKFRKKFNLEKPKDNWLYISNKKKKEFIKEHTDYEIKNNCIIAYKAIKNNLSSVYKPGLQYKIGETYTSSCNCNLDTHNSFGLAAWDKENALKYYNKGKLLKVSIPIKKLGACILKHNNKLRAFEMTVLEEVKF